MDKLYSYLSLLFQKDIKEFLPSSILGATKSGITLFELAGYYYNFFCRDDKSEVIIECQEILHQIASSRLNIKNIFLKTGTTNSNKDRYAILGNNERVFALLRGDNPINDESKEGNFIESVKKFTKKFFQAKTSYQWNK